MLIPLNISIVNLQLNTTLPEQFKSCYLDLRTNYPQIGFKKSKNILKIHK